MAATAKMATRALRATPLASTMRPAARRVAVPRQAFQRQARRGYASEAPKPSGGSNTALIGAVLLERLAAAESVVAKAGKGNSSDTTDQGGVAAARGLGSLTGVATASLALEGLARDGDTAGSRPHGRGQGSGAEGASGHLSGSSHCVYRCCVELRLLKERNGYQERESG